MEKRTKPQPTPAQPGSREKVEVIRLRWENGEELWHQDDDKQPMPQSTAEQPWAPSGIREIPARISVD